MEGKASDWRPGPTVCRCCLSEGCYKDISTEYFWMGKREVYSEMLSETLNVSIAYSQSGGPNSNSRLICEPCISRLRDASEFKRQVVDCEKTFMHHLDPGTSSKSREFAVESVGEVKIEVVKQEKDSISDDDFDDRPDFLDVDSDDDLDDQPLTKLASKIPKKESVDLLQLLDTSQITVKRKANLKLKAPPKKIVKKEVKPTASKAAPAKQAEKKKGESQNKLELRNESKYKFVLQKEGFKDRLRKLLQCSRICPFKWKSNTFRCVYCPEIYINPAELREHHQDMHTDIKLHEISHGLQKASSELLKVDVTNVSCKLCNTKIDSYNDLKNHLIEIHNHDSNLLLDDGTIPFKLNPGSFKCGTCDENFPEYMTLCRHLKRHFQKYVCETCGAGFVSLSAMRSHYSSHETGSFPCTECSKVFRSKQIRAQHTKIVHLKLKLNRCPLCSESFMNYDQKLNHIFSAHGIKVKEFKCDICSSVFVKKARLTRHVRITHTKEKLYACEVCAAKFGTRNTLNGHMLRHTGEKNHQCDVCQKSFGRKYTLREHMRIHLNDRRFVCRICGSSFVQKCSLKQHGKTHHPDQPNPASQYD